MSIRNFISLSICMLMLSACGTAKLETINTSVDRPKLEVDYPQAIVLNDVEWYVITKDNIEEIIAMMEDSDGNYVLFAVTADGYKKISENQLKIRNYIRELRDTIKAYKDYYE